ncbi:hypothetical protein PIB30_027464 [Stylosanthes scabra]|uniref:DUF4283 domain-containing protein n=1 Tax=Stylosanthes scabra TaxID=79078 RepID=A0ABU6ZB83_9FABA|nr:hypothetical protein [Stylosanthes scabra]
MARFGRNLGPGSNGTGGGKAQRTFRDKWCPSSSNNSRRVWIEHIGLPLHAWSRANIEKIAGVWGPTIYIDDKWFQQYCAIRILVDSGLGTTIQAKLPVIIDGMEFLVYVKETSVDETYPGDSGGVHDTNQKDNLKNSRGVVNDQLVEAIVEYLEHERTDGRKGAEHEMSMPRVLEPTTLAPEVLGNYEVRDGSRENFLIGWVDSNWANPIKTVNHKDNRVTNEVIMETQLGLERVNHGVLGQPGNKDRKGCGHNGGNVETGLKDGAMDEDESVSGPSQPPGFERLEVRVLPNPSPNRVVKPGSSYPN